MDRLDYDRKKYERLQQFLSDGLGDGPKKTIEQIALPSRLSPLVALRWWVGTAVASILLVVVLTLQGSTLASGEVQQVIPGPRDTLFITVDGALWGVGASDSGQLGFYGQAKRKILITEGVLAAAVGKDYILVLKQDGSLWSMGSQGRFPGTSNQPSNRLIWLMDDVASVASGDYHALVLKKDGTLLGMGGNQYGELGIRLNTGTGAVLTEPKQIMVDVKAVFAGPSDTFILRRDGSLWSCGGETTGELGYPGSADRNQLDGVSTNFSPKKVMDDVVQVAAGLHHTLILDNTGALWVMGSNLYWQLGLPAAYGHTSAPIRLTGSVKAVAAGDSHSLFLKEDGTLWGMGLNTDRQLGTDSEYLRGPVQLMSGVANVWAKANHTIILKQDESLLYWGSNDYGQLSGGR